MSRWKYNIKMDFKNGMGMEGKASTELRSSLGKAVVCYFELGNKLSGFIKRGGILD